MMTMRQSILIFACAVAVCTLGNWQIDFSLRHQNQSVTSPDAASVAEVAVPAVSVPVPAPVVEEPELPDLLPDFSSQPVHVRKSEFVAYVIPFVEEENLKVYLIRQKLHSMQLSEMTTDEEIVWLKQIGRKYRVSTKVVDQSLISQLSWRIDQLPPSLVLAQAAIESAWGTSRFAQKANNLFGHLCMTPGCGIVPKGRPEFASYEVRKFDSVEHAVHRYFMNLNTNRAYAELRDIRACHRLEGESLSGPVMAGGLLAYSGNGTDYIDLLRAMIRVNDWAAMDGDPNAMQTSGCNAMSNQLVSVDDTASTELQVATNE